MKPPNDLAAAGSAYWRRIQRHWRLDEHQFAILHRACRCLDVIALAEADLVTTGPTVVDRFKQSRPAPAVTIIRDYSTLFARLVRELGLSAAASDGERPPQLTGRYKGRR